MFFFKQRTAYAMRMSDWSSAVCSSDLAGGQVGDTGEITSGTARAEVLDTVYALPGLHRHVARITEGSFDVGDEVTASIDSDRRNAIRRQIGHASCRERGCPYV